MALQNAFGNLALDATLAATNTKLDNLLTELQQKLETGSPIALDSTTLAALETITVANSDFPDAAVLAKLEAIRLLLATPPSQAVTGPLTDTQLRAAVVPTQDSRLPTALGQAAMASSLPVTLANEHVQDIYVTGQGSQTASGNNILLAVAGTGSYDTLLQSGQSIRSMYCQIISTGTIAGGAVTFEGSNDNTTFVLMHMFDDASSTATLTTSFSVASNTNRFLSGPCKYRYVRIRISTAITGGATLQCFTKFSLKQYQPSAYNVAQPTASFMQVQCVNAGLTKGTQGSTGVSTQDLKDAGRVAVKFSAVAVAAGSTGTETAISLTKSADNGATSSAASFVITSAKRFRIQAITFATRGHTTPTSQVTTFNFRVNTAGAVTTSSTPIELAIRSATPATADAWDRVFVPIPDGWEILGDGTIQFGVTAAATYTTNAPTWDVTIIGYEY